MTRRTWRGATAYLRTERELLLTDLVAAETVYVLESFYETPRDKVGEAVRSLVAFDPIVCVDPALLLRAVEVYEIDRIDFAEAYLIACAETGVGMVPPSTDRSTESIRSSGSNRRRSDSGGSASGGSRSLACCPSKDAECPVASFEAEVLDVGGAGFADPQPVQTEQHRKRGVIAVGLLGGEQEHAELRAVETPGVRRVHLRSEYCAGFETTRPSM
ncbi:MAG TPA: hypothetical protein VNA57_13165 [Acidimicrobiales bacterium]|nr:hypothetical protein [Acidimicrobiales bacterium]